MNARFSLGGRRRAVGVGLAAVVLAFFVASAAADTPKYQFTKADQAAARAAVVQRADLAGATGWKGGMIKPVLSDEGPLCPGFDPKTSDLVVTGAAQSKWTHTSGDLVVTQANIMQTEEMAKLDWQRTFSANLPSCLGKSFAKSIGSKGRIVSAKSFAFPRLASHVEAIRLVAAYTGTTRKEIVDFIFVAKGRTEVAISLMALGTELASLRPVELHFVTEILSRLRA